MRLIDADNIKYHKVWVETPIEGQHDACIMAYENSINELPTIEAIPIEWIERRIKGLLQEPIETDEPWFPISHAEIVILEDLIDDWENK